MISSVLLLLSVAGVWLARSEGAARRLVIVASGALFLWAWPPFEYLFLRSLERPAPFSSVLARDAGAIVVLSGEFSLADAYQPETIPGNGTYRRCWYAAWLYKHRSPAPVIATGGPLPSPEGIIDSAASMGRMLEDAGVPRDAITTENQSRTTYENAVHTAALLKARGISRILLVTEAFHMARAAACFRRQGIDVVPAPCAFRSVPLRPEPAMLLPNTGSLRSNDLALHEWIGLLWYRITGKI